MQSIITVPEKMLKTYLKKDIKFKFIMNQISLCVVDLSSFILYIRKTIESKTYKTQTPNVMQYDYNLSKWYELYYKIIRGKESAIVSRWLGKELLFRKWIIQILDKGAFVDAHISNNLKEKFNLIKPIIMTNKLLFNKKRFQSVLENPSIMERRFTYLSYYERVIYSMPFCENAYKKWVEIHPVYHLHKVAVNEN